MLETTKNNKNKKSIIEKGDLIEFEYRIKPMEGNVIKFNEVQKIIVGNNQFMEGFDEMILGKSSESKILEFDNFFINEENEFFPNELVLLGIKILKHEKGSTQEIFEPSSNKINEAIEEQQDEDQDEEENENTDEIIDELDEEQEEMTNKKKIKNEKRWGKKDKKETQIINENLQEENKILSEKINKLEEQLKQNLVDFKLKQEQISSKAQEEVLRIKNEIKEKAKQEISENQKYLTQKLIEELLTPLNNLYSTVEFGSNQNNPIISGYVKGFNLVVNQIFSVLERNGVSIIQPNIGDEFNPEFHQAHEVEKSYTFEKDKIIRVISRGYSLNERVIKPALVVVSA